MIAGIGYFLQKVFLLVAEGDETEKARKWRIAGWSVYLIGLPMWLIVFYVENDWILFFVEAGGAPSMVLGLIIALRKRGNIPYWLDHLAIAMTILGITVSLYSFGGLVANTQFLELGVAIGFLVGTYQLAKKQPSGWLWYLLMNGSNATLMWLQGYELLMIQQLFSFLVGVLAFAKVTRSRKRI